VAGVLAGGLGESAVAERIFQDSEAHKLGLLSIMRGQALVESSIQKLANQEYFQIFLINKERQLLIE